MEAEDAYDVRAVEATLARMKEKRRRRGAELEEEEECGVERTPRSAAAGSAGPSRRPPVSDLDLSAVDSASESDGGSTSSTDGEEEGGEEERRRVRVRVGRAKLRDSLDLSMSMSVVLPAETIGTSRRVPTKHTVTTTQEHMNRGYGSARRGGSASEKPETAAERREVANNPGAGKLIERRHQLEREAAQQQQQLQPQRENSTRAKSASALARPSSIAVPEKPQVPAMPVAGRSALTGTGERITAVSRIPKPADVHGEHGTARQREGNERQGTKTVAEVVSDKSVPTREAALQRRVASEIRHVKQEPAHTDRRSVHAAGARPTQSSATNTTSATAVPPQLPSVASQHHVRAPAMPPATPEPASKPRILEDSTPFAPVAPVAPVAKKAIVPTVGPPTATASTSAPANAAIKPGYVRATAIVSNHAPPPPAVVLSANREPQEDPEDIIDDLLTAEEIRLRESLDKLSTRLSTLTTARASHPRTTKPPSNQLTAEPSGASFERSASDDTKAIRAAAYGGGTHARLHQQTSPTTRASHAKRSELSGGVHKARVRTGGVLVQDAAATRLDLTGEGKHKIVVKKDLAHLLF